MRDEYGRTERPDVREGHKSRPRDSALEDPGDGRATKRRRRSQSPLDGRARASNPADRHVPRRHRRHESSHGHRHGKKEDAATPNVELPFSARTLSKSDLTLFRPLFAYFLSIQKQIEMEDLEEREVKGRWKSFVGKWNRGELAEGWYDPDMFSRVAASAPAEPRRRSPEPARRNVQRGDTQHEGSEDDAEDDYGPILPGSAENRRYAGPGIPSLQDLSVRNEMLEEDREESRNALRADRKADRALQKERLDEILPREDAGTRERRLEKRQMVNDKMREFRDKSPGMEGGNERDLMGGGDSLDEYKQAKEREQRKKSEREIRREEIERARREEIEARRKAWMEREEGTVSMLREIAKQRFG